MEEKRLKAMINNATGAMTINIPLAIEEKLEDFASDWLSVSHLNQNDPALFRSIALGLIRDYCEAELDGMGTPEPIEEFLLRECVPK